MLLASLLALFACLGPVFAARLAACLAPRLLARLGFLRTGRLDVRLAACLGLPPRLGLDFLPAIERRSEIKIQSERNRNDRETFNKMKRDRVSVCGHM